MIPTTTLAFVRVSNLNREAKSARFSTNPESFRPDVGYEAPNIPLPDWAPPGGELARPQQQQQQQQWQQQAPPQQYQEPWQQPPPQRSGPLQPDDNWRRPLQVDSYQYRTVQGNSRKTFQTGGGNMMGNEIEFSTDGRELYADMEVWQGPNNTPQTMKWYAQDGNHRIRTSVSSRSNSYSSSTIETRNRASIEFPMNVQMRPQSPPQEAQQPFSGTNTVPAMEFRPIPSHEDRMTNRDPARGTTIQGAGSVKTYPIDPYTASVQVRLDGQGYPITARMELLQGPDCVKIVGELYNDGLQSEFVQTVLETPGYGSTLRIVNTGPLEYPIQCTVAPASYGEPVHQQQQQQSVFDANGRYVGY